MINRLLREEKIKTPLDDGIIKGNASSPVSEVRVKSYVKQELAKNIGIISEELKKLKSLGFYHKMANKISSPLIKLYCATKFATGK